MRYLGVTHVAITVPDVPAAEDYYRSLLGLTPAFRDVEIDGEWYGLRPDSDWRAADGCTNAVSALGNGALMLFLEQGDQAPGLPHRIGLHLALEDLTQLRIRAFEHNADIDINHAGLLRFRDRFGIQWEAGLAAYDRPAALGAGARLGRWWPA